MAEEFELAYFANISDSYGYNKHCSRYNFPKASLFGKLGSFRYVAIMGQVDRRNAHIKQFIMQTYINKNGEEPPSFEVAFFNFLGDKYVYYSNGRWKFNIVKTMTPKAIISGLPRTSDSASVLLQDEDAKGKMIAVRNKYIHDYLIGKYRAPAKIEIDDLTKKMNSAKLDDSAKAAVSDNSDSVESVDLDDYILKTKAQAKWNKVKIKVNARMSELKNTIKELENTIKEMEKKMAKMIPEEIFDQVVKEKVDEIIKDFDEEDLFGSDCSD